MKPNRVLIALVAFIGSAYAQPISSAKQYTEGTAVTTAVGPACMWRGTGNAMVPVSASDPLPVEVTSGEVDLGATTLASTFKVQIQTDNAGLATDTVLTAARNALQIMDDWDETDRAKVNPIVGQAGVQGGSGGVSAITQRVVLATDVALPAGTNAIGKLSANSGVDIGDVDVTSIAAGNNNIGDVDVASIAAGTNTIGGVRLKPDTSGGYTIARFIDLDESDQQIKGTAGQLYGWYIYNNAASTRFVKLYNATAASVSVGTTTPVITIPIPAGGAANVEFSVGIAFGTAITAACTTGVADADTGAPSANDCVTNFFYN